jgi:Flp pilus assembly protein TadG
MRASRCVPRRLHLQVVAGRARERGSTSIQMVVLMPALFALMFMGMQAALIYHARSIAIAAAEEGARAAGAQGGSVSGGTAAAAAFVASAGGGDVLRSVSATGNRGTVTATVTVTGAALSVVPGWSPRITQSATVPVERLSR